MHFPIFRIDDRLLHGSVIIGWGESLDIQRFTICDDTLDPDSLEGMLFLAGVPEEKRGEIMSCEALAKELAQDQTQSWMILFSTPARLIDLLNRGVKIESCHIGGLHHHAGCRELLPYLFIDQRLEKELSMIMDHGVRILCQDLPGNRSHELGELLNE